MQTDDSEFVRWEDGDLPGRRGRKPSAGRRDAASKAHAEAVTSEAAEVRAGVTQTWLASAFKMDTRTVKHRLGRLKPLGPFGPRNAMVYDFGDAVTLLAKPPPDQFAAYMKTLRVQDLPTHLQESYWGALRKKQLWELHAGELWKTADVLDVLGEVFQILKSTIQLWPDNLDPKGEMNAGQRDALTEMTEALLAELHARLVEMPKLKRTPSSLEDPDANPDSVRTNDADEDLIG